MWGPAGDASRTKDVTAQVQRILDSQTASFSVASLASEGDPALNVVKTLRVEYVLNGKVATASATDPETIVFWQRSDPRPRAHVEESPSGLNVVASMSGDYVARLASGKVRVASVRNVPAPTPILGNWKMTFASGLGAPSDSQTSTLGSWSDSPISGVRYYSGSATYVKSVDLPRSLFGQHVRQTLDLGHVGVLADVTINGRHLGVLWRSPFRLDVTGVVHPGNNVIQARVTNLWPNRMIGDEDLPEDGDRNPNGTLKTWPSWVLKGGSSPTGRIAFTSWKLWHRQDRLLPSGLIGPVSIQCEVVAPLKPATKRN